MVLDWQRMRRVYVLGQATIYCALEDLTEEQFAASMGKAGSIRAQAAHICGAQVYWLKEAGFEVPTVPSETEEPPLAEWTDALRRLEEC